MEALAASPFVHVLFVYCVTVTYTATPVVATCACVLTVEREKEDLGVNYSRCIAHYATAGGTTNAVRCFRRELYDDGARDDCYFVY